MKIKALIIFLFYGHFLFSQSFEKIDKIKFEYSIGGSSWGKNGVYSKSEIFELIKGENGDFKLSKQLKVNSKVKNEVFSKDSIIAKLTDYRIIKKEEVENLLSSLNSNKENFTEEFLKQNFTKPTKKEIFKIAKLTDNKFYFKNDYDEKSDIEAKYSQIQEFKYFEEYLKSNSPNINEYLLVNDGWDNLMIYTYSDEEMESYNLQFFRYCGQPIIISQIKIDKTNKETNFEKSKMSSIINLDVNLILLKIVSQKTKLFKSLDLNNIRDKYIRWFLENKIIEFKY